MASKSLFICVACLVFFCFMLMKNPSAECVKSGQYGCSYAKKAGFSDSYNRKVLSGVRNIKKLSYGINGLNGSELRKVPSGPDPLHHNGNSPKKPRSP